MGGEDTTSDGEPTTSGPSSSSMTPATESGSSTGVPPTTDSESTSDGTTEFGSDSTSLSGSDSSGDDSTGPIHTSESTSTTDPPSTSDTGITDDTGGFVTFVGFIVDPDFGGGVAECDVWAQDCPDGEKCSAWANDGGNVWNAWKCVPIDPSPGAPGDACLVEGSGVSGIDDCELGSMCFYVDSETNQGTCVSFCAGNEMAPLCSDPETTCMITNDGWLPLCLPTCSPLDQDCPASQGCYPVVDTFVCAPDASGEMGAVGDPCEYVNVCDPGLICATADTQPGCAAAGCCAEFCDLDGFVCPADTDCLPFFEAGAAPPGWEDVGICGVPT